MKITPEKGQRIEGASGSGQPGRLKEGATTSRNKTSQYPPVEKLSAPTFESPPPSSITGDDSANKISRAGRRLSCFGDDSEEEVREAEAVARHIGIPFQVVDLSREYEGRILSYFRSEYARGRTPNPCVRCNAEIKFGLLLEGCRKLGLDYDYFATGHYARVRFEARTGRWLLLKAREAAKDQSYFLSLLSQEQLGRSLFPLGELSKVEVRKIARENNLPVSEKEESQDFYAGDYRKLLPKGKPGPIKDLSGKVLGQHDGIENYTVGQRRGLGIASGSRLYVVRIEAETNTVYIGKEKDLMTQKFKVDNLNWIARLPEFGKGIEARVKVRHKSPELECRLLPRKSGPQSEIFSGKVDRGGAGAGRATPEKAISADVSVLPDWGEVTLLTPYKAVTPGQVAVFYEGEVVLAGGFIDL
ncbi:MAG TPA: tRNA 2-thiouridine(34) synthase MnmA [Acidobacteria bacterium]|nr:tRNA 2-thiouridine(34) synthase MnmA [Acidobacteriota bacterium]